MIDASVMRFLFGNEARLALWLTIAWTLATDTVTFTMMYLGVYPGT